MKTTYDAIVIGAGGMGSAAAYYLAKSGQSVLLLEQFELNHRWGSSWGHSRIIRYSYTHPAYVRLARETYPLWHALEEEAGEQFYIKTGGIDFGHPEESTLAKTRDALNVSNIPYETLSPQEAGERFPQFRFAPEWQILYQADAGIVPPSRAVMAHLRLAEAHGAVVRPYTTVTRVVPRADGVDVHTQEALYSGARLVITAGAWAGRLIQESLGVRLPLQPLRVQEVLFQPPDASYSHENMPIYIYHSGFDEGDGLYGLPSIEGSGVKSGVHGGQEVAHPSEIKYLPDADVVPNVRAKVQGFLPMVTVAPVNMVRVCLYTMTPDQDFIVDTHPIYPHIAIGAGFSGHGFKFSTGIGSILADLVTTGASKHDISLFKLSRFL
jgi:monomeric sarcosine oxidase